MHLIKNRAAGDAQSVGPTAFHMRLSTLTVFLIGILIVLCPIVVGYFPVWESSCGAELPGLCANEVLDERLSPDGSLKAVVFERDCGATTDYTTQVSIVPPWRKHPYGCGNVFVADTNHGEAPSGPGGGPTVSVKWVSNRELKVIHHPKARVMLVEPKYNGIAIWTEANDKV